MTFEPLYTNTSQQTDQSAHWNASFSGHSQDDSYLNPGGSPQHHYNLGHQQALTGADCQNHPSLTHSVSTTSIPRSLPSTTHRGLQMARHTSAPGALNPSQGPFNNFPSTATAYAAYSTPIAGTHHQQTLSDASSASYTFGPAANGSLPPWSDASPVATRNNDFLGHTILPPASTQSILGAHLSSCAGPVQQPFCPTVTEGPFEGNANFWSDSAMTDITLGSFQGHVDVPGVYPAFPVLSASASTGDFSPSCTCSHSLKTDSSPVTASEDGHSPFLCSSMGVDFDPSLLSQFPTSAECLPPQPFVKQESVSVAVTPSDTSRETSQRQLDQTALGARLLAPKTTSNSSSTATPVSGEPKLLMRKAEDGTQKAVAVISKTFYVRPSYPKKYCQLCDEHKEGFRGEHELRRHIDRAHKSVKKMWVCVNASGKSNFFNSCKHCRNGKRYGAYYNAAAHLRRQHFNPRQTRGRARGKLEERRGGKGGGDWPSMEELKKYMKEVEVRVPSSYQSDRHSSVTEDDDLDVDRSQTHEDPPTPERLPFDMLEPRHRRLSPARDAKSMPLSQVHIPCETWARSMSYHVPDGHDEYDFTTSLDAGDFNFSQQGLFASMTPSSLPLRSNAHRGYSGPASLRY